MHLQPLTPEAGDQLAQERLLWLGPLPPQCSGGAPGLGLGGPGKGEASLACNSVLKASQSSKLPPREGQRIFSGCAELLQRYQHMVNLPSVQKCRVICPSGDFCIFILMSVFKAYETENC